MTVPTHPTPPTPPAGPLGYVTMCPHCGGPLVLAVGPAGFAPWLCQPCSRSWFGAELTDAARAKYRPELRDFGFDGVIAQAVHADIAADRKQGHNVPPAALTPIAQADIKAAGL